MKKSIYLSLKAITPVHVGNGDTYVPGFDYAESGGDLEFVDQRMFFQQVEGLTQGEKTSLAKILANGRPIDIIRNNARFHGAIRYRVKKPGTEPRDYKRQVREASGLPILPGSSLKGSLVTAYLWQTAKGKPKEVQAQLDRLPEGVNPKSADDPLLKKWLGKDPNHSFMRLLQVGDSVFHGGSTAPAVAKVTRLANPARRLSEKKFTMGVEVLLAGSEGIGLLQFDTDQKTLALQCPDFMNWREHGFAQIWQAVRARTRDLLEAEIAFLQDKQGDFQQALLRKAQSLLQHHLQLPKEATLIPVGWGIGWRGMTGRLIEDHLGGRRGQALRKKLQLSPKYLNFPFPKSRRVVLTEEGPLPLGWLELRTVSREEYLAQRDIAAKLRRERLAVGTGATEPVSDEVEKKSSPDNLQKKLDSFKSTLPAIDRLAGEATMLIQRLADLPDDAFKSGCLDVVRELYGTQIHKAARKGKKWATKLQEILSSD